eukprot:scaffold8216_cov58-Cylindrotheca_fusiformis.AAC.1
MLKGIGVQGMGDVLVEERLEFLQVAAGSVVDERCWREQQCGIGTSLDVQDERKDFFGLLEFGQTFGSRGYCRMLGND